MPEPAGPPQGRRPEGASGELVVADAVDVLVLVDNTTDFLSSSPPFVEGELSRFWQRGPRWLAGDGLCCAAHGLSLAITVHADGRSRTLLFDTGPDGEVLLRNVARLGFDMGSVDALFLSHGHWDHAGGMLAALDAVCAAKGAPGLPTFMHPGMYRSRATRAADGTMRPLADIPAASELQAHGADVRHASEPMLILYDLFFVSGEIPRRTAFERGMPGQHRRTADGSTWEPDPLLLDERFIAVRLKGLGLLVFSACSHAGVINVLTCAREAFPQVPVHGVVGGLHLAGPTESAIPDTVAALSAFQLPVIVPAHCTGWRALGALAAAFPQVLTPSAVGKTFHFLGGGGGA